jgi:hypothetical protein
MHKLLAERGFGYGYGHLSPDCSQFCVSIPKNASSFLSSNLILNGWSGAVVGDLCSWNQVKTVIVVLRDPLKRWISGMAQYLHSYIFYPNGPNSVFLSKKSSYNKDLTFDDFKTNYNIVVERLIFDVVNKFDDHVWPQIDFFENLLPHCDRKYFYIDYDFEKNISSYLQLNLNYQDNKNNAESNDLLQQIQSFLLTRLDARPELVDRVRSVYRHDYELIEQIKHDSR